MINVLKSGIFTTIQDKGRVGYRNMGVPLSGAMDKISATMANKLLNNDTEAAVLEFTMIGPELQFTSSTTISICGADFQPKLNGNPIECNKAITVNETDVLTFRNAIEGNYGYLAVLGGFQTEEVLGSRSFYRNITKKERLEKGDTLSISPVSSEKLIRNASFSTDNSYFSDASIEVYPGPEFDLLPKKTKEKLVESTLKIGAQSSRMAYVLDGFKAVSAEEILTAPVQPGTVQLTPSGVCVVLMRDAQSTGGYARVLQLTEKSICKLAQKRAGEQVSFKIIESL